MSGTSHIMHDNLIGAGCSHAYIDLMKLYGWLPIKDYFKMRREGIELDWVLVLTMEDNGFQAIPMVAEYCVPIEGVDMQPGWYMHTVDGHDKRIDDWTNVIMFKTFDNAGEMSMNFTKDVMQKEGVKNQIEFYKSFHGAVISSCIDKEDEKFVKWERNRREKLKKIN